MATPSNKVDVNLIKKDGSEEKIFNVEFFPKARVLLFNGANSNITINQSGIDGVSIQGESYSMASVEVTESGFTLVRVQAK